MYDHDARPSQTQMDKHHGNNATIRSMNASRAKNESDWRCLLKCCLERGLVQCSPCSLVALPQKLGKNPPWNLCWSQQDLNLPLVVWTTEPTVSHITANDDHSRRRPVPAIL